MNHSQILKSRANRKTRLARPYANFVESFEPCLKGASARLKGECPPEFILLLERSVVITAVTAVEVYYRDMLDAIFRYCAPTFLEPKLKNLHPEKYDIISILDIYRHKIHPVELLINNQSFQSVEKIDKVFSNFTDKGFWKSLLDMQVSFDSEFNSENTISLTNNDYEGLKAIFQLRHELVHDPARKDYFTYDVLQNLDKVLSVVFVSDVLLVNIMTNNYRTDIKDYPKD